MSDPQQIADEVFYGNRDYEVVYQIPASEDWPFGSEVGFVMAEGWMFASNFTEDGQINPGHFAVEVGEDCLFPEATQWMITDNDAIDYGLPRPTEE